jgi:hypothetical protein
MQTILLPAGFSNETIESIEFVSLGRGQLGLPFLAAATVIAPSPVPEPGGFAVVFAAGASFTVTCGTAAVRPCNIKQRTKQDRTQLLQKKQYLLTRQLFELYYSRSHIAVLTSAGTALTVKGLQITGRSR